MLIFSSNRVDHFNEVSLKVSRLKQLGIYLLLLSIAGVPPLTGFMPKLMMLDARVYLGTFFVVSVLTVLSVVIMGFYLRLTLPGLCQISLLKLKKEKLS